MALNVNIIGRDSEGNLRALKVNSEGNLEISDKDFATESTLSIIKDNQGRLYGKYGEEWLPILVDSTGRLLLASDVTVNAEGLTVDLGQIKQGPAGTEPWPVQLSGTSMSLVELSQQQRSRFFRNGKYLKTVSRSNPGYNVYFGDTAYATLSGTVPFDKRGLTDLGCMIFNDTDKIFSVEALHLWTRYTEDYSEDHTNGYATLSIGLSAVNVPVGATLYIDLLDVIADDVVPFWGFSEGVSLHLRKTTPEGTGTVYCSWFGVEAGGVS